MRRSIARLFSSSGASSASTAAPSASVSESFDDLSEMSISDTRLIPLVSLLRS
jgi:hypothetical protein